MEDCGCGCRSARRCARLRLLLRCNWERLGGTRRCGKLRVRLSACMWVGLAAAFAFELRRILGRIVRIFRQNRAKSRIFQQKPEFSAEIGRDWGGIAPWWASSGAGRWKIMDAIVVLRAGAHGRSHYYNVSPICVTLHSDEGGARFFLAGIRQNPEQLRRGRRGFGGARGAEGSACGRHFARKRARQQRRTPAPLPCRRL